MTNRAVQARVLELARDYADDDLFDRLWAERKVPGERNLMERCRKKVYASALKASDGSQRLACHLTGESSRVMSYWLVKWGWSKGRSRR